MHFNLWKINYFISICFSSIDCKCPDYRTRQQIHRQLVYRTKNRYYNSCKPQRFLQECPPGFGNWAYQATYPRFGLGVQGMGYINTSNSKTAFDASDLSLLGKVNLMNLFAGYTGVPPGIWSRGRSRCGMAALLYEWFRRYELLVQSFRHEFQLQSRRS